jgi:hypothetical protein
VHIYAGNYHPGASTRAQHGLPGRQAKQDANAQEHAGLIMSLHPVALLSAWQELLTQFMTAAAR